MQPFIILILGERTSKQRQTSRYFAPIELKTPWDSRIPSGSAPLFPSLFSLEENQISVCVPYSIMKIIEVTNTWYSSAVVRAVFLGYCKSRLCTALYSKHYILLFSYIWFGFLFRDAKGSGKRKSLSNSGGLWHFKTPWEWACIC